MGGREMATDVHCDAWNILTKGGSKAQIGILGFTRDKVNVRDKANLYIGGIPTSRTSLCVGRGGGILRYQHLVTKEKYKLSCAATRILV